MYVSLESLKYYITNVTFWPHIVDPFGTGTRRGDKSASWKCQAGWRRWTPPVALAGHTECLFNVGCGENNQADDRFLWNVYCSWKIETTVVLVCACVWGGGGWVFFVASCEFVWKKGDGNDWTSLSLSWRNQRRRRIMKKDEIFLSHFQKKPEKPQLRKGFLWCIFD